jgi:hypothetical protein
MARNMSKNTSSVQAGSDLNEQCATCGGERPEYTLEDKQLCVECYNAEIDFWNKKYPQQ